MSPRSPGSCYSTLSILAASKAVAAHTPSIGIALVSSATDSIDHLQMTSVFKHMTVSPAEAQISTGYGPTVGILCIQHHPSFSSLEKKSSGFNLESKSGENSSSNVTVGNGLTPNSQNVAIEVTPSVFLLEHAALGTNQASFASSYETFIKSSTTEYISQVNNADQFMNRSLLPYTPASDINSLEARVQSMVKEIIQPSTPLTTLQLHCAVELVFIWIPTALSSTFVCFQIQGGGNTKKLACSVVTTLSITSPLLLPDPISISMITFIATDFHRLLLPIIHALACNLAPAASYLEHADNSADSFTEILDIFKVISYLCHNNIANPSDHFKGANNVTHSVYSITSFATLADAGGCWNI